MQEEAVEAPLRVSAICAVVIELLNPIQTCERMHDVLNGKATAFLLLAHFPGRVRRIRTSHTNTCEDAGGIRCRRNKYVQALQATREHANTRTHTCSR